MWRRCNRAEFHSQALLNDHCQMCLFHQGKTSIINKGRVYCWQVSLFFFWFPSSKTWLQQLLLFADIVCKFWEIKVQ